MQDKEITILVNYRYFIKNEVKDYLIYQIYSVKDGRLCKMNIDKKKDEKTIDIYENILADFLIDKKLIAVSYDTFKMSKSGEEYLGLKLVNDLEEKLNVYFNSKSLYAFSDLENLVSLIKSQDFFRYAQNPISKNIVERMTIRPSDGDRSSILYIFNNNQYSYFNIQKQLGFYYRKNNHLIDEVDLQIIFSLIRYFINCNLENNPYYEYMKDFLFIKCNKNACIEINDLDLIEKIEKARILDDLWLVMHNLIERMPNQEESLNQKENLKRIRTKYLESKRKKS